MIRAMARLTWTEFSVAACLGGAGSLLPGGAMAGVWTYEPQLAASTDYSTNPQLRQAAEYGYSAALLLGLAAAWDDGARHIDLSPSVRLTKAGGDYFSGMNAYYLSSLWSLQSDRSSWKASGRWASDSTVLLEPSIGTLTRSDFPRRSDGGSLDWTFHASSLATVELSASAESVGYSGALRYGLYDYRDQGLQGSLLRAVSERNQLELVVGTSRYEADEIRYTSQSSYAQGGVVGALSPRWSYTALYGLSRASADGGAQSPTGNVYQLSLTGSGLTTSVKLSATKSLQPSGFGTVVQATEYVVQGTWQDSERGTLALSARSVRTADVFGQTALATRAYAAVAADRSWLATPVWTVGMHVDWQRARANPGDQLGQAWAASLTVTRRFGKVRTI